MPFVCPIDSLRWHLLAFVLKPNTFANGFSLLLYREHNFHIRVGDVFLNLPLSETMLELFLTMMC